MARKPVVAGNWKMNKTAGEAKALIAAMLPRLQEIGSIERMVFPVYTALPAVAEALQGTDIVVGAQNLHWEESGAFTGEIAPAMVKEFCTHVIIGHSERRTYFGETDETVNKRVKAALAAGIKPIVCVGETLEEREAGKTAEVVHRQVVEGLKELDAAAAADLIIAYEPVWAIGTGMAATPEDANAVLADTLRPALAEVLGADAAAGMRILYGGSVKPGNARPFFEQPEIDGALVGGASLRPDDFIAIAEAAVE